MTDKPWICYYCKTRLDEYEVNNACGRRGSDAGGDWPHVAVPYIPGQYDYLPRHAKVPA